MAVGDKEGTTNNDTHTCYSVAVGQYINTDKTRQCHSQYLNKIVTGSRPMDQRQDGTESD